MKKLLKISAILVTVVLVVVVGLSLFIRSYLDSEKLKSIIIPMVKEQTGRDFGVQDIQASLFRGIVVKGIVLKEADGKTDFIRAEEFVLRIRLLPLIHKQVVIKQIQFYSPYIRVIRSADGQFNFSSMIPDESEESPPGPEEAAKGGGLPVSLVTEGLRLVDARVEFHDEMGEIPDVSALCDVEMKISLEKGIEDLDASGTVDLEELIVKAEGLESNTSGTMRLDRNEVKVELNSIINNSTVNVTGSIKDYLAKPDIKLDIKADKIDVDSFMPFIEAQKWKKTDKTEEAETQELPDLKAAGRITLGEARYRSYTVKNLAVDYGYADGIATADPFSVNLAAEGDPSADGKVDGNLRVDIEKEEITGTVNLSQFKAQAGKINTMTSGTVRLESKMAAVELESTVNEGVFKISGSVRDYLEKPDIKLNISADKVDVNSLMSLAEIEQGKVSEGSGKAGTVSELPDVAASGRITIGEARYETYMVRELAVDYNYTDGIATFNPFSVRLIAEGDPSADGKVDGNLRVDIEKEEITGLINLRQFRAKSGNISTVTSGTVKLARKSIAAELESTVNKDIVKISGSVRDYLDRPDIRIDISAKRLDIEGIMPPETEKKEELPPKPVKADEKAPQMKASGRITVGEAAYKTVKVKDFLLAFGYVDGAVSVKPLKMGFISEEKIKADGGVNANVDFTYDPANPVETVKNTLRGNAAVETGKGTIEQTRTSEAVMSAIGLKNKGITFDTTRFDFDIRDRIVNLVGVMNGRDIKLDPRGKVDMDTNMDIKTSIKLSPESSSGLGSFTDYFKDDAGWATVPLEIRGTFEDPKVSIDKELVGRMVQKQLKKEIKKTIQKETEKKLQEILPKELKEKKKPEELIKDIFKKF